MSNVTYGCPDLAQAIRIAHANGIIVMVDGAQGVVHFPADVQKLDIDFYAFSGHKLYGPTGIGALYGKPELLAKMTPWLGGGKMIAEVSFGGFKTQDVPSAAGSGYAKRGGRHWPERRTRMARRNGHCPGGELEPGLATLAEEELKNALASVRSACRIQAW